MKNIYILLSKEIKYLLNERMFYYILGIYLIMWILSTFLWYEARQMVISVYNVAKDMLLAHHQIIWPLPISWSSWLAIVKNTIVYNIMIWWLLAIILWYFIWVNDKISNTVKLLFSRSISKKELFISKALSIALALFVIIFITLFVTVLSLIIFKSFHINQFWNLIIFFIISYIYILSFGFISLWITFLTRSSAFSILLSLTIWIIITFVLPDLTSALYPTASLNPVLPATQVLSSPVLDIIHNIFYPFSISQHYKELSNHLIWLIQWIPSSATLLAWPSEYNNITRYSSVWNTMVLLSYLIVTFWFAYFASTKISEIDEWLVE